MDPIKDISDYIFLKSDLKPVDVIFIPGSRRSETMEYACQLYLEGYASYLIPSGQFSVTDKKFLGVESKQIKYKKEYKTECDFYCDIARQYGIKEQVLLKENQATYTMENATYSRRLTDNKNMEIKNAILCCKSFHARRAFMYYQLAYPETSFLIAPIDIDGITKKNWFQTKQGIQIICGELKRIATQFETLIPLFLSK